MKVIMCSRFFPKGHPKTGQPTHFVEKILYNLYQIKYYSVSKCVEMARLNGFPEMIHPMHFIDTFKNYQCNLPKGHTIRAGERFKPGEMVSLRVWSDKPYKSKQIEFAQVEVKKTWKFEIDACGVISIGGWYFFRDLDEFGIPSYKQLAANDGLTEEDFISWFSIHPKLKDEGFRGQIITWSSEINY